MRLTSLVALTSAVLAFSACAADSTSPSDAVGADADAESSAPVCNDTCPDEGTRSCNGNVAQVCAQADDGCLAWVDTMACGVGSVCSDGACTTACPGAACNVVGAKKCEGTAVAVCDDSDGDGCLDWGSLSACDGGLVCAGGFCALSCSDDCTTVGAKKCEADGVVTCGDHDADGCLEWGAAVACAIGESCSGSACAVTCTDECTTVGATRCDGNGVATCGQLDADSCLEWGTVVACDQGDVCSNGACATTCTSECSTVGAKACDGQSVITCQDPDGDGCLAWSAGVPCGGDLACAAGQCTATCSDDCTSVGAKACDLGGRVITCGNHDADTCLEWSSGVACDAGLTCANGNCASTCTSTCSDGARQCAAGTAASYQICDDYNGDGCSEWGTATACGGALACSGGACQATCTNTCPAVGGVVCDGNATRTCGDFNGDGCFELGTAAPCALTETCANGTCTPNAAPATVLINEVVVDSVSSPDKDTFVELYAPAGTDLSGYTLVGVNGANGAVYATINLAGTVGLDGLFVVAHPQAHAGISDVADMQHSGVDFQNGPDAIQVRYGATVIDALGYGTFGPSNTFGGEGSAAPAPGIDEALVRDANHSDSNDNEVDFTLATQSPGLAATNGKAPIADLLCPADVLSGELAEVDGSGSSDDGAIVSWRFDFGDGTTPTTGVASAVEHAWQSSGTYTIVLTVTDDDGLTRTDTCQVTVSASGSWTQLAAGAEHTCGVRSDGTLWCWGNNDYGALGNGTTNDSSRPVKVIQADAASGGAAWSDWTSVSAGGNFTCGIRSDGTLWCWGAAGIHGDGSQWSDRNTPAQVLQAGATPGSGNGWNDWTLVSAGSDSACGLRANKTAWCWGRSEDGVLGDGDLSDHLATTPTRVLREGAAAGSGDGWADWDAIAVGGSHVCGLRQLSAWCWGSNLSGQLGAFNLGLGKWATPFKVPNWSWLSITTGARHTCASTGSTIYCWGNNMYGQLGDSSLSQSTSPVRVGTWNNWLNVSAGADRTCGLRNDGTLWCWGAAEYGQRGDGTSSYNAGIMGPVRVLRANADSGSGVAWDDWSTLHESVGSHICAGRSDGSQWCWGRGAAGQRGDGGTYETRTTPAPLLDP